jgi:hypothetical protein
MHSASVDDSYLTRQAATCRRLAAGIWDDPAKAKLLALAAEYEARRLAVQEQVRQLAG